MKLRLAQLTTAAVVFSVGVAGCNQPPAPPTPTTTTPATTPTPPVDTKAIAAKLVKNGAVKEGEVVLVTGGAKDWQLIEDLAVEIRKAGAFPLVNPTSEQLTRRLIDEVPAKYDSQSPTLGVKLTEMADAVIALDFIEHNDLLANVPSARTAAQAKAAEPVGQLARKRNQRLINLGNGLLPTASTATDFDISLDALSKTYWAGINTDYDKLQATAKTVSQTFSAGKRVHITNPNGTDLTVDIAARPVFASDGVISPDDLKRGGAGVMVWLPSGEVYLAPIAGTAEGKVVADNYFFQGKNIQKLEVTFKAGKITAMTAASGIEPLKALYDASGAGKDEFSFIDIGINPDVVVPPGSRMTTWVAAGMVTVGTGNNLWTGGNNSSPFGLTSFLPGSTLEIDGKAIVKAGKLVQ